MRIFFSFSIFFSFKAEVIASSNERSLPPYEGNMREREKEKERERQKERESFCLLEWRERKSVSCWECVCVYLQLWVCECACYCICVCTCVCVCVRVCVYMWACVLVLSRPHYGKSRARQALRELSLTKLLRHHFLVIVKILRSTQLDRLVDWPSDFFAHPFRILTSVIYECKWNRVFLQQY